MNDSGKEPVFSVMVTVYNQEKFLEETLDSLFALEGGYPYEIVIGDDCSSDSSRAILKRYAERYPDIIKLHLNEKNLGMVGNYYNLLSHCRGKYISLCSADDCWFPHKAKLQVEYLESHPEAGMVYGKTQNVYEEGYEGHNPPSLGKPTGSFEELIWRNEIPSVTVMARRELAFRFMDEMAPTSHGWLYEDYPMWLWFSMNSRIDFIDETVALYRIISNSLSHQKDAVKALRYRNSDARIRLWFAGLYYDGGQLPNDLKTYCLYEMFKYASAARDYERLEQLRPDILRLSKEGTSPRVRKMVFGTGHPRLYRAFRRMVGKV